MEEHLRAGVAIYNAGYYHAAHDAWEAHWLDMADGDDRDFLQGLIQFTAAVHHTTTDNWEGARGLAESAQDYLATLDDPYRGVSLEHPRTYLAALERDPRRIGATAPPPLEYDGVVLDLAALDLPATSVAATVLAEELGYDEAMIEQAVRYAEQDREAETGASPFVTLVFDFVRDDEHRAIVAQRLGEHVQRRDRREADVDGLF